MLRLPEPLAAEAQQGVFFAIQPIVAPESRICQWRREVSGGPQVKNRLKLTFGNADRVPGRVMTAPLPLLNVPQLRCRCLRTGSVHRTLGPLLAAPFRLAVQFVEPKPLTNGTGTRRSAKVPTYERPPLKIQTGVPETAGRLDYDPGRGAHDPSAKEAG